MDGHEVVHRAERIVGFREMLRETVILWQLDPRDGMDERPAWASVEEWAEIQELTQEDATRFFEFE